MEEKTRFLILLLQGESFAIPITSLLEITVPRNIQKDPKLSEIFEGKIDYRGKMVPVVNLKKVLKLPGSPGGGLIVVKSSKGVLGLLVDAAKELLETAQRPAPMPRGVVNPSVNYFAGILRNNEDLVLLLNEDGLLP
ncbi:MAG: chemotaxis protein CheW [Nitrospirota bacterium]